MKLYKLTLTKLESVQEQYCIIKSWCEMGAVVHELELTGWKVETLQLIGRQRETTNDKLTIFTTGL